MKDSKLTFSDIKNDVDKNCLQIENQKASSGLFVIKSANSWIEQAKKKPIPKMLFSEFWHENEICILFADSNLGKSALAIQIADSISRNVAIKGFKLEAKQQMVLYFDFEMSDKQFEGRYSKDYTKHFVFNDNLQRVEIDQDADFPLDITFDEYLNQSFEQSIIVTKAKILIVDNITYLKGDNEKAKEALPLMKHLKKLKSKYGLSILILSHTPKRDLSKIITRNDIQGSKMLINFVDSAFAIGESFKDESIRYIKQIKQRNTELIYGGDNVVICNLLKEFNILEFRFYGYGNELEHLRYLSDDDRAELESKVLLMRKETPDISFRAIAKELGINHMKVKRIIDKNR